MTDHDHHLGEDLAALVGLAPIDPERRQRLEGHLKACRDCQRAVLATQRSLDLLDLAPVPQPSPSFDKKLAERLKHLDTLPSLASLNGLETPSTFGFLNRVERGQSASWVNRVRLWLSEQRVAIVATACASGLIFWMSLESVDHSQPEQKRHPSSQQLAAEDPEVSADGEAEELLEIAQDLEFYGDFDVVEKLDVLDDLEIIESMVEEEAG